MSAYPMISRVLASIIGNLVKELSERPMYGQIRNIGCFCNSISAAIVYLVPGNGNDTHSSKDQRLIWSRLTGGGWQLFTWLAIYFFKLNDS